MKNVTPISNFCANAWRITVPLGIGAAIAASNGLAVGTAVGVGLFFAFRLARA